MSSPMKGYTSPTHSSAVKTRVTLTQPPVHLKEKLETLTYDIETLKEDFAQGLAVTESLEKNSGRQYDVLTIQVTSLKTAFLDLSSAVPPTQVIGQLDSVKSELLDHVDRKVSLLTPRLDSLFTSLSRNIEETDRLEGRLFAFQQDSDRQFGEIAEKQASLTKELTALWGAVGSNGEKIDRLSVEQRGNKGETEY